ncbi:AsmA family protein [Granulicella tundricola]|uniref:AsmA family protein n=1 Tax=Granulicella tundricola (strain ATCC BAA-1859 / DSM 23138 / MP5ACTX9) TaxID=1198114 RepID=E8X1H6_GRATM|nr:AsmA family protein [Granulicella tundricola]ADW70211.1 AsmA family protein [Granulicella tundricola MP5ACTX9]
MNEQTPINDPHLDHLSDTGGDDDFGPPPFHAITHRRAIAVVLVLAVLVLLALLPPLLNVNRYKRQIVTSISTSLGRPVHIDSVSLNLLPLPSFTLENFVISEDPAFGAEPVLQANEVRANLRVSSLWRRRVEFSRIALDSPSVNLVHLPDGRWNLESILLQASRMPAAPTAQKKAGTAPRFPYIEATGARVNLKMGLEKMPISLTEADFALFLPEPNEWHLRLKTHFVRTDAPPTDTGILRVEGTLGRASTLAAVPVDLHADWETAPLGAVSWVLMGRDAGLRGEMNLTAAVTGTVGSNNLDTHLTLQRVRRADFVPEHTLDAELTCKARVGDVFHAFHNVRCAWPSGTSDGGLMVTGELPDLRNLQTAQATATFKDIPAASLLDALRVASNRVSPTLKVAGGISGTYVYTAQPTPLHEKLPAAPNFTITHATLDLGDNKPLLDQDLTGTLTGNQLTLAPIPLALAPASREPASLDLKLDEAGYTLHLSGTVLSSRLLQLAKALPQVGDGLEALLPTPLPPAPIRVDLLSNRTWGQPQTWSTAAVHPAPHGRIRRR